MDYFWSLPRITDGQPDNTLVESFAAAPARHYDAGSILSDPGVAPCRVFLCTGGTLKVTKLLSNGREILITMLESGSIWSDRALLKGYWRGVFVETVSPCETHSLDKDEFEKYVHANPKRLRQFMARISEQMSDALTLLEDFRGRDGASRLASVLVRFSKQYGVRHNDAVEIYMPLTHQDLANMIGTARETVSRSMARFRAEGYVRDGESAKLQIVNLNSLESLIV